MRHKIKKYCEDCDGSGFQEIPELTECVYCQGNGFIELDYSEVHVTTLLEFRDLVIDYNRNTGDIAGCEYLWRIFDEVIDFKESEI